MGGHDIYHVRPGLLQIFHINSLFILIYDTPFKSHMPKIMPGTSVCRILHGDPSVTSKDRAQKHQQIIVPRPHKDLLRFAVHTSRPVKILCDGFPKGQFPAGIAQRKE